MKNIGRVFSMGKALDQRDLSAWIEQMGLTINAKKSISIRSDISSIQNTYGNMTAIGWRGLNIQVGWRTHGYLEMWTNDGVVKPEDQSVFDMTQTGPQMRVYQPTPFTTWGQATSETSQSKYTVNTNFGNLITQGTVSSSSVYTFYLLLNPLSYDTKKTQVSSQLLLAFPLKGFGLLLDFIYYTDRGNSKGYLYGDLYDVNLNDLPNENNVEWYYTKPEPSDFLDVTGKQDAKRTPDVNFEI